VLKDSTKQYNADETGFQLDPKTGLVLAPRGETVYTEAGGSKEQISVLVTTRADGKVMRPCIVYPYKRALPKAIVESMPEGYCGARSDSGWMTSDVFFEYLANTFIPELANLRRLEKGLDEDAELLLTDADWVVLWIDGYSSHLTMYTSKLCELNKVILYCFKAHASHICQPNDVGPFKPLKSEWKNAVRSWRDKHPYEQLTKVLFAPLLATAITTLNTEAIVSGYRATGLFPFDPDAIHYKRLTATNRAKFDERAFPTVPDSGIDFEVALRCVEMIIGRGTTAQYENALKTSSSAELPAISGFEIWKHLKLKTSVSLRPDDTLGSEVLQNSVQLEYAMSCSGQSPRVIEHTHSSPDPMQLEHIGVGCGQSTPVLEHT
jgi:hypothetical protein